MLGTILLILAGALFFAGIVYLMIPRAKKDKAWKTVINWILYIIIALDLGCGISFMYINMQVGHAKATSTAIFIFIGSAIVLAIILARLLGLFGGKKAVSGGAK